MVLLRGESRLSALLPMMVGVPASSDRIAMTENVADSTRDSTSPAIAPPPLPPRHPDNIENFSASQWMQHFASTEKLWQLPGPPRTAPLGVQSASVYDPGTYGPMPGSRLSPHRANGSDNGGDLDDTLSQASAQGSKPPLPVSQIWEFFSPAPNRDMLNPAYASKPRPHIVAAQPSITQHHSNHDSQHEYLKPVSYSPVIRQPLLNQSSTPTHITLNNGSHSQPPPPLPPAPPPKVPPDDNLEKPWPPKGSYKHDASAAIVETHDRREHSDNPPQRFNASQDHVTYSIPSSIWRQEHVSQPAEQTSSQAEADHIKLEGEPQRSDSFYWQSPHSSPHSTKAVEDEMLTKVDPEGSIAQTPFTLNTDTLRKDSENTGISMLLSHSTLGPYGASALGFGGPSDWEHFGDYEAEEIDDTDLYTRPKSPIKSREDSISVELPTSSSVDPEPGPRTLGSDDQGSNYDPLSPQEPDDSKQSNIHGIAHNRIASKAEPTIEDSAHGRSHITSLGGPQDIAEHRSYSAADTVAQESSREVSEDDTLATNLDQAVQTSSRASSFADPSDTTYSKSDSERLEALASGKKSAGQHMKGNESGQTNNKETISDPGGEPDVLEPSITNLDSEQKETAIRTRNESPSSVPPQQDSILPSSIAGVQHQCTTDHSTPSKQEEGLTQEVSQQPTLSVNRDLPAKARETEDPYAGLDDWGKASLNRYIAMLREESHAMTDVDKLKIFTVFTARETRLRAILYGAEAELMPREDSPNVPGPIKRTNTSAFKRSSKALPALPKTEDDQTLISRNDHIRKPSKKVSAAAILGAPKPASSSPVILDAKDGSRTEEPPILVESPVSEQYSPGGRPIVRPTVKSDRMSYTSEPESLNIVASGKDMDDIAHSNPLDLASTNVVGEKRFADRKDAPSYKPFKYSDGRSEVQNYAANRQSKRQSQFRPYAAKSMGSDEYREMFQVEKYPVIPTEAAASDAVPRPSSKREEELNPDLRRFVHADFDPLVSVLPQLGEIPPESIRTTDLQQLAEAVPDDFSFIHQTVVAWDAKARRRREVNEHERHARQVESEQKIDALFDDHEIGYGDISELESGFKRAEAARKAEEDRSEYKTFVAEVFNVVWARLHYEIDQLSPHYLQYMKLLNDTSAGKDMFESSGNRLALAPTIDSLLTLHQKLEIRYQKAFESVLERDRRLKRTELSPWYSLGDVAKVKQLEKQFEDAEKKAIVEYCRQRDIRANDLMDVIDQNTLRGVGSNQDYMEMIMKAVRRIASGRAFASQPGASEPGVGLQEVTKAKSVTKALATSSEQIVQTFHVADMLLNAADYELSVAKAKLSGADVDIFQRLKEERTKEDQKLMRDLDHRLALIREDSRRTHDEIVKLLLFLGVQSGHAESSTATAQPDDVGHEERIQRALEEAKQRNAMKESTAAKCPP